MAAFSPRIKGSTGIGFRLQNRARTHNTHIQREKEIWKSSFYVVVLGTTTTSQIRCTLLHDRIGAEISMPKKHLPLLSSLWKDRREGILLRRGKNGGNWDLYYSAVWRICFSRKKYIGRADRGTRYTTWRDTTPHFDTFCIRMSMKHESRCREFKAFCI